MSQKAVFDCMVFLQGAMRATGPAADCFRLIDVGIVDLCLSSEVLVEIREVLARPTLQKQHKSLSPEKVERFMAEVVAKASLIESVPPVFSYARDPKDEKYVNLAVAASAQYLVSRDKDLLELMDQDFPDAVDFRKRFPGITVVDPVAFLRHFSQAKASSESPRPTPE